MEKVKTIENYDAMAQQVAKLTLEAESHQSAQNCIKEAHEASVAALKKGHETDMNELRRQHALMSEGLMQVIDIQGSENMAMNYMMQQDLTSLDAAIKKGLAHMKAAEREAAMEAARCELGHEIETAHKREQAAQATLASRTAADEATKALLSVQLKEAMDRAEQAGFELDTLKREEAIAKDSALRELQERERELRKVKKELSWLKHQKGTVPEGNTAPVVPSLHFPPRNDSAGLMYGGNPLYLRTPRLDDDSDPSTEPEGSSPVAWR